MHRLQDILGRELNVDSVNRALRDYVRSRRPAIVGAVQVTCSDETEREIAESFQHWFAEPLLPELKFWNRSVFRTANLGGRYEFGAIHIADEHYDNPDSRDGLRVLVVKVNSHVAVNRSDSKVTYGKLDRYSRESPCCGALHALLNGTRHPAMDAIREALCFDECDRVAMLLDPTVVDPELRSFVAAVVNARLQARSAIVDIQSYETDRPTLFVVLACVTLNRSQRDTEFVVGMYWSDSTAGQVNAHYIGLGDDPSKYQVSSGQGLRIEDDQLSHPRAARDHRRKVVEEWRARRGELPELKNEQLEQVASKLRQTTEVSTELARESLKTLLWITADLAPVPLSILLFAKGLAGVHHLYRVHRLARGVANPDAARDIIDEVVDQTSKYTTEQAIRASRSILEQLKVPISEK